MSEKYIKQLAEELDLPVEKVALVWSTADIIWSDIGYNTSDLERLEASVRSLLRDLFPK